LYNACSSLHSHTLCLRCVATAGRLITNHTHSKHGKRGCSLNLAAILFASTSSCCAPISGRLGQTCGQALDAMVSKSSIGRMFISMACVELEFVAPGTYSSSTCEALQVIKQPPCSCRCMSASRSPLQPLQQTVACLHRPMVPWCHRLPCMLAGVACCCKQQQWQQ